MIQFDEGKLWSFIRSCMLQGADIDRHTNTYEQYSAKLDSAAAARTDELLTKIKFIDISSEETNNPNNNL